MARFWFGGTAVDGVFTVFEFGNRKLLQLATATLTVWDSETGGTRHTDLVNTVGTPVTAIETALGQVPRFQGPDGVTEVWVDDGDDQRHRMTANLGSVTDDVVAGFFGSATQTRAAADDRYARNPFAGQNPLTGMHHIDGYGAVGDGVTLNTVAVQNAITDSVATGGPLFVPDGDFVSGAVYSGAGSRLRVQGATKWTSILRAPSGMTGFILRSGKAPDVRDLTIIGSDVDGCYGIGSDEDADMSQTNIERVQIYATDYGVRLAGGMEIGLKLNLCDLWVFGARTCGVMVATGGKVGTPLPASGQSAWTLDNVVVSNANTTARSIPAAGFTQTDDSPNATTDTLNWSGADNTEFGYVVMRLPFGSGDTNAWEHVAYVASGTITYAATKTAGVYYTYRVLRASQGVYLRYGKAISIGTIQTEYVAKGLDLRECRAVTIGTFYEEWRGNSLTAPTPRGDGITATLSSGLAIESLWADKVLSALVVSDSPGVSLGTGRVDDAQRSILHVVATAAGVTVDVGPVSLMGTTPTRVTTDGSAFSHNISGRNLWSTDPTLANREHVNHTTLAEFEADFRGTRKAAIGADTNGGYEWQVSAALPTAGAAYDGQVRRTNGKLFICFNDGSGYAWVPWVKGVNVSNAQTNPLAFTRTDGSAVASFGYDGAGQPTANPSASTKDFVVLQGGVRLGTAGPLWRSGTGTPEGVLTAPVGSIFTRTDGGAATTFYVKETGAGNTGWVAK